MTIKWLAKELRKINERAHAIELFLNSLTASRMTKIIITYRFDNKSKENKIYRSVKIHADPRMKGFISLVFSGMLIAIENRHSFVKGDIGKAIYDSAYKRSKIPTLFLVNTIMSSANPPLAKYSKKQAQSVIDENKKRTISHAETLFIGIIQSILNAFVSVADSKTETGCPSYRSLEEFELNCLTCAILDEFSEIDELIKQNSESLRRKLSKRTRRVSSSSGRENRNEIEAEILQNPSENIFKIMAAVKDEDMDFLIRPAKNTLKEVFRKALSTPVPQDISARLKFRKGKLIAPSWQKNFKKK